MPNDDDLMVARFWTRARRFPKLIGKAVNGERIWGGPYTLAQAIGGFFTVWLLWQTRTLWGPGQFITELLIIGGIGWGAVWTLGKLPLDARNPLVSITGVGNAVVSPRGGNICGRRFSGGFGPAPRPWFPAQPAPVLTIGRDGDRGEGAQAAPEPRTNPAPAPATPRGPEPSGPRPAHPRGSDVHLTGLQQLLADAARIDDDWEAAGRRVQESLIGAPRE